MDLSLTILQQDIVRTLAYFDVFSYPLTKQQVYDFLPRNSVTLPQVVEDLEDLVSVGLVRDEGGYYYFSDRAPRLVTTRREDEERASVMSKKARRISLFLKQIPFVRGVFITGSLSKNVASPSSDVDFMIVTAPNRLWISKMILTGIRRIFLFNSIKYSCFNLFVTEKGFVFPERNLFNAIEISTTQVLWNESAYEKFLHDNSWIQHYLPNWEKNEGHLRPLPPERSQFQKIAESFLNLFPLASLDTILLKIAHRYWKKKNAHLDEGKFDALFQCRPDVSSVWSHDHQTHTMKEYDRRLAQFGIEQRI
jgi:hypothetical protein